MVNDELNMVVPEDWNIKHLDDFGYIVSGGTPSTSVPSYWNGMIPWCTPTDITGTEGIIISKTEKCITEDGLKNSSADILPSGSLLLCTRATIGDSKINSIPMATNQGFKNVIPFKDTCIKYLYYLLQTKKREMLEKATASTFAEISKSALCEIPLQAPEKQEQEQIAQVLFDIDALITDLQKLIQKKKNIRQGTMQMLLSGKHRLDGYSSLWRTSELSKVTSRIGVGLATSVTQYYRDSGTIIFRNLNIKENYLDDTDVLYLDEDFASRNPNKAIHEGDVLTVHTGYVGISCVVPQKYDGALTFTTLITTTNKKELLPEYLSYHLNSSLGHRVIEDLQTSGGRNNLNVSDFEKYTLTFPKDINEQRAIVTVLADMDVEIRKLEEKLSKYQKVKQGMMEELLTGKVRLM